jgi:hypothetical protein
MMDMRQRLRKMPCRQNLDWHGIEYFIRGKVDARINMRSGRENVAVVLKEHLMDGWHL